MGGMGRAPFILCIAIFNSDGDVFCLFFSSYYAYFHLSRGGGGGGGGVDATMRNDVNVDVVGCRL